MTQHTFSQPSQSKYTLGKDLNLLPFELFNLVKAGKLHPLDKNTGQPIPWPDVQRIKDQVKKIEDEMRVLPLKRGTVEALYRGQEKEEEKQKLDSLVKKLQKEHDAIVKELESQTAIDDWTKYDPPDEPKHLVTHLPIDLMKAFDILQNALFKKNEIDRLNLPPKTQVEPAAEVVEHSKTEPENYFRRIDAGHWAIKFQDEFAAHLDHIDGLLYIAHILNKKGKDISDQVLYQLGKGVPFEEAIEAHEMNEPNLSQGFSSQSIGTSEGRKICQKKYNELKETLETASLEEQGEIKKKMEELLPYLKTKNRNFPDPNDKKAQSNIKKRIDLALGKLKEENMPEMAKHLKDTIKTEYYCRRYVGTITWKIIF